MIDGISQNKWFYTGTLVPAASDHDSKQQQLRLKKQALFLPLTSAPNKEGNQLNLLAGPLLYWILKFGRQYMVKNNAHKQCAGWGH